MPDAPTIDFGFVTDKDALAAVLAKQSQGTRHNSKMIAEMWDDTAKSKAFFSSRVTSADILEGMRQQINHVVSGQMSEEQSVHWIRTFLESKGDSALTDMGFLPLDEAKKGDSLAELGAASRLQLIVSQNVAMARSARRWQQMKADADIVPYVRYHTKEDSKVRNSHRLLDGLVFRKDDPALLRIFPPQDFRCRCHLVEMDEDEAADYPIQEGLPEGWKPPDSGYTFNPEKWAAQGQEARATWGDDLIKEFEADSLKHGEGRIKALEQQKNIMRDLSITSPEQKTRDQARKAVSEIDTSVSAIRHDIEEKKAKAEEREALEKLERETELEKTIKTPPPPAAASPVQDVAAMRTSMKADLTTKGLGHLSKAIDDLPDAAISRVKKLPTFTVSTDGISKCNSYPPVIEMEKDSTKWMGVPSVLHHEYGHHVHNWDSLINVAAIDPGLEKAMKTDYKEWKKQEKKKLGKDWKLNYQWGNTKALDYQDKLSTDLFGQTYYKLSNDQQQRIAGYFDTIGGLSKEAYGWGHGKSYYRNKKNPLLVKMNGHKEAFANCFRAAVNNWKEYDAAFPELMLFIRKRYGL